MAALLVDVLRSHTAGGKFNVLEFIVMRDRFHALLAVQSDLTIEMAVQTIKRDFSCRAKKDLVFNGEIWEKGFSHVKISDGRSLSRHVEYMYTNLMKAGYGHSVEEYPYCSLYLRRREKEQTPNG